MSEKVLFIDTNLGLEHALRFGRDGYETFYAVVHGQPYPKMADEICGYGFDEIKKIWDWGQGLEEGAKTIIFTDSGFGYLAEWLRSRGYHVIGADGISEKLELDRYYVRKVFTRLGIDIPPARVVKGVDNVKRVITEKGGKNVVVKISRVRGDVETFKTNDPYEAEIMLSRGGFKIFGDDVIFILEEEIKACEVGIDTWFNGKEFIGIVAETIELKGAGNITKFVPIEDSLWYGVLQKLEPWLRKNGYVGMFCMEGFYDGNVVKVTDVTPRFPYICSYAYPKVINNYSEFLMGVASGEDVILEPKAKYSTQIGVYTDDPDTWRRIRYDRDDGDMIAYRRVIKDKEGHIWFVPGDYVVGVGISANNVMRRAINEAIIRAEAISSSQIYTMGREFRAYIYDVIEQAHKLGYDF